jgi:phosphoesterase RecJ-like protein
MTTTQPQWNAATNAIRAAHTVLVVSHISPDGDAIGSSLGLANALREMGKTVTVANDDGVPDYLRFLPGAASIVTRLAEGRWDVMISTDASDEIRTGACGAYGRAHSQQVINLDHHITNTYFGDVFLVVPGAVSATEIVFDWWQHAGHPLSQAVALPLLTGLVTDTIGFRVTAVSARTLAIAQALMQAGASLPLVTARTLDTRSYRTVELWKQILPSVLMQGQIILATVRLSDLERAGLDHVTDGGMVSFLNTVDEALIAVVFKEQPETRVEISFRSRPGYDVAGVAIGLGGGGHKQAAGVTLPGTLAEVQARVLPLLQQVIDSSTLQQPG